MRGLADEREDAEMDQLLFHPRVVHLPIALAVLMPLIAGGVVFAYRRAWLDRRVWVLVCLLQAVLVGSGLMALRTGESEEERVEQIVPERHVESHEEAAERFFWASVVVLALMAVPLVLPEGDLSNALLIFACVGSAIVLGFGYRAGEAGGRLVYEHGAADAYTKSANASPGDRIQAIEAYEDDADSDE